MEAEQATFHGSYHVNHLGQIPEHEGSIPSASSHEQLPNHQSHASSSLSTQHMWSPGAPRSPTTGLMVALLAYFLDTLWFQVHGGS